MSKNELKEWIQANCPMLWTLLNKKAQKNIPVGLSKHISERSSSEIEDGRNNLKIIEKYLRDLERLCGLNTIGNNYRRDLSGVNSENQLAELFCEIALCATLGEKFGEVRLRPPTGKGTYSDCLFHYHGFEIYAEAKRYVDPWPHIGKIGCNHNSEIPYTRSIAKSKSGEIPNDSARPRSMDLRSKLRDVHRQFPDSTINILFVFHFSFGESKKYLTQAFFGDSNFFRNEDDFILEEEGLFSIDEWKNISACCLSHVNPDSDVIFPFIWKNPLSYVNIPDSIVEAIIFYA